MLERAVVDHGDAARRDALAEQAGEGRSLLAIEVALEAVADRLVQQNSGQPGPSTAVISPAGAATASSLVSASRTASSTMPRHFAGSSRSA